MFALAAKENQPARPRPLPSAPRRSDIGALDHSHLRHPPGQNQMPARNFSAISVFSPSEEKAISVQAKLEVGSVDDPLEQQADRMADHVTGGSGSAPSSTSAVPHPEVPGSVERVLGSSGQPLDAQARAFMEPRFGFNFSQVRVHAGSAAATTANELGARAYTAGQQIVFGAGHYQPGTAQGQHLLAHELTHVVQQTGSASGRRASGLIQRDPDDKKKPAGPTTAPTTAPTTTPAAPTADKNSLDDKAKAIIAAAQDTKTPVDQRAIAAVNDIVKGYFDPAMVDSVEYKESEPGLATSPVGTGAAIKGKITVGKYFVEHMDQFSRRVLQVGHELEHVQQQRDGKGGADKSSLREFLAFYWEATQPEKAGTGRMAHATRLSLIDQALRNYYCLPDADQKTNQGKKDDLLTLRGTEETKSGHPHTDPPSSCDAKK